MDINEKELLIRIDERVRMIQVDMETHQEVLLTHITAEDLRLRQIETDMAVVKTKAGMISTGISTGIAVLSWILPWMFKGSK